MMINHKIGQILTISALLITAWIPFQAIGQDEASIPQFVSERDTLFNGFALEELERYRRHYIQEITRLQGEREDLRQRGIRDGELFLSRNPDSKVGDKVKMRLAELYYEQAQDDFQKKMQDYDRQYSLFERGQLSEPPEEPIKNINSALDLYISVIERHPTSDLVDDAFFNIGFLLEEVGYSDSALVYYEKVLKDFPESRLTPDVMMRIGEYYFNPPINMVEVAIEYFEKVLLFRDSPRYDEALYRLGWSYYRLNQYSEAISYFTLIADDVERTKQYDPLQKYTNPSLVDESIEYIGLSFLEFGGAEKAAKYIKDIGGRDYGVAILKRIGDAYMNEKEDYENALISYNLLLNLYSHSHLAPSVQNRVVQAYRRLEDQSMAYLARDMLFTRYRKGSEWWEKNTDKEARERAYVLTESALRDNITVLLNRGQETDQPDFYNQAVIESRKYLQYFPADSSAPMIHWNLALTLDTKLHLSTEAYDEYLKISNLYWDSKYQRFAAENAVALAREAAVSAVAAVEKEAAAAQPITISDLKKEAGEQASRAFNFREKMKLQPTELSPEEQKLAEAYDNYIKLFPHDKETPIFLANAGALYYRHYRFSASLKYFNTLLRHFPGSEEFAQARFAILESYFGKADFRSTEIIARRIIYSSASEDIKSKARRRLAESIYLSAEVLADQEKHLEAGDEYRRVVREVPRSEFADLALFNAALEYDKAAEYMRAIETYNYLLATHPNSGYIFDAQNNLAFDYVELVDFRNAALTYERLAAIHPDVEKARDALFNSSLYFGKAQDWEDALKINKLFLQRFPKDEVADDLAYEIAGLYREMNEPDKAHEAYQEFVEMYPNSARVVEALYMRGRYLRQLGENKNAIIELQKALVRNNNLDKLGLDKNDYYAAETEFELAMIKFEEFDRLEFRLPETNLERNKERKKNLLLEIVRHLGNCASYGTIRLYEATHMIGYTYQRFAETWAEQDVPEMEINLKIVAQKEINDAAAVLYERARDALGHAVSALERLVANYRTSLEPDTTTASADTLATIRQDSVLRIADKWIERSKLRLTEVNYEMAELTFRSARLVQQAPVPKGLSDLAQLVFRKQVMEVAVVPLLAETVAAHYKNVKDSDSLGYVSQWVALSRQKIVSTKSMLPDVYTNLALDAFRLLQVKFVNYANLVYSGRRFEDVLNTLLNQSDDIANAIDYSKETMSDAMDLYVENIQLALDLGVKEENLFAVQDSMMASIIKYAVSCDSIIKDAKMRADQARGQFIKTQDPIFEEGLFTYETNYFALRDVEHEILRGGYELAKNYNIDNVYSKNLTLRLVRYDPEQYAGLLDLEIKPYTFTTDSTWLATTLYYEGWTDFGFDASGWMPAQSTGVNLSIWFYEPIIESPLQDSTVIDTIEKKIRYVPVKRLFLRKTFSMKGLPVTCKITIPANLTINLYFNGDLIKKIRQNDSESGEASYDPSALLVNGANVIAVEARDVEGTFNGFRAVVSTKSLPGWDEKVESLRLELVSDRVTNKLLIDKGRIP